MDRRQLITRSGAAFAALGGGLLRASLGTYTVATMISGSLCIGAAVMVLRINKAAPRSMQAGAT